MKNFFSNKIITSLLVFSFVFVVGVGTSPQTANAGWGFWDTLVCTASPVDCALRNLLTGVVGLILQLASLLATLGGYLLNGVVYHTIVDVKENYDQLKPINEAWTVLKDIANMSFIFVLLYASIRTILGVGGDDKKIIVNVVIAAILMNFSMFFTRVVIDISNLFALTFYDAIAPGVASSGFDLGQAGISSAFMQHLGLSSLFEINDTIGTTGVLTVGIMGTIMILIAAFSFFAIALMFIIRYVILILVIILSPVFFVGLALPSGTGIGKYKDQWLSALTGQAFFAPIYFLLTWVAVRVMGGVMSSLTGSDPSVVAESALSSIAIGGTLEKGAFLMFLNFAIVIVLIITSLLVAVEWANKVGGGMNKLTGWATGKAGAASFGMAGRFGRGTLGRAASSISERRGLKDAAARGGVGGAAARLALASSRKAAGSSFDFRATGTGGTLGAGKGQKGGFNKDLKDKTEAEKKYAESLKPSGLEVSQAENELKEIQKTGTNADIAAAQARVDKIKGLSEEEARKREAKRIREEDIAGGGNMTEKIAKKEVAKREGVRLRKILEMKRDDDTITQKEAEERVDAMIEAGELEGAWKPKTEDGLEVKRKKDYAKTLEKQTTTIPFTGKELPISFTGGRMFGLIGKVKRERLEEALAIRKSIKEKKPSEKIAEQIAKEVESASDEAAPPDATPPAPTPPPTT